MEPKDLKKPEGLKSKESSENEVSEKKAVLNDDAKDEVQVESSSVDLSPDGVVAAVDSDDDAAGFLQVATEDALDLSDDEEVTATEEEVSNPIAAEKAPATEEEVSDSLVAEVTPVAAEEATAEDKMVSETVVAEETAAVREKATGSVVAEKAPAAAEEVSESLVVEEAPAAAEERPAEEKMILETVVAEDGSAELEDVSEPSGAQEDSEVEQEMKLPVSKEVSDTSEAKPETEPIEERAKRLEVPVVLPIKAEARKVPDYSAFSQIELVNALRDLVNSDGEHDIKEEIDAIKAAFYQQVKDEVEEQKRLFLEEGGVEDEFVPEENPYEPDIRDLLKQYRQVRHEFNKKLDQEKELNLQVKYEIIEEIKGLIHKEESINKTFQEFRELQQRWREIGLVPQAKMKDLWDNYHFHVENFYDYIKINKELRDLDLKKNLEMKIRLCEQAEELLLESNTIKAFNQLQKLHERWREIGPVPRENKDDIWERFKTSTAKINKKHQEYFESRKSEQRENLDAKRALCEQVEEIIQMDINNHKDWGEKSNEVVNLQKVWRTIGFAPRKENNRIYKRFREACDAFFNAKRDFYSKNKELQLTNLQLKTELCMQAEALKDSTDWAKTTQDIINIQKQWKEIGPIPRKNSDALWKRFREACDYFFDKKSEHFSSIDSEQDENLKKKEDLIRDVESFIALDDPDQNLVALKDFQRRWTEIGHVPIRKKEDVQKRFRDVINKLFDDLNIDESKRNLIKFRSKIASISESSRGQSKMRLERDKYMTRLKQMEGDLVLLDNNIGFFAKSKNAEKLIRDVNKKIEQTKEKIEFLKNKIRVIDEMDQLDE